MEKLKEKITKEYNRITEKLNGRILCKCYRDRKEAFQTFERVGFPNRKVEDWKYTPLSFLNKYEFDIAQKNDTPRIPDEVRRKILSYSQKYLTVTLVNGFVNMDLSNLVSDKDVYVQSVEYGMRKEPNEIECNCPDKINFEKYIFTAINNAITQDGVYIRIEKNTNPGKPILIINLNLSEDKPVFSNPRNIISLGKNAVARVVAVDMYAGKHPGFSNCVTDIELKEHSYFDYTHLQTGKYSDFYNMHYTGVKAERHAYYNKTVVSMNGNYIRNNDNVSIREEGAEMNLNGLFYPVGKEFVDNHTFVEHDACNGLTKEDYKGIIDGKATGVFNGMILVRPDAQQTNAFQSNHNILLSDDATINTKPELEIYADDVKCSHGATSGSIDQDKIFYLKTRGISEEKAKALLIAGFAADIIDNIKIEDIKNDLKSQIYEKLGLDINDLSD